MEVKMLKFTGSTLGYVKHEVPKSYVKRFFISIAPFLINNLIGIILIHYVITTSIDSLLVTILLLYLSFSVLSHSFSSKRDVENLLPQYTIDYLNPLFWISIPLLILLYVISHTQKYYTNYIFAFSVIIGLFYFLN